MSTGQDSGGTSSGSGSGFSSPSAKTSLKLYHCNALLNLNSYALIWYKIKFISIIKKCQYTEVIYYYEIYLSNKQHERA